MSNTNYSQRIRDMTWSYSRLTTFEECPYKFFMKYLSEPAPEPSEMFYASYGSFMHRLIEMFHNKKLKKEDLPQEFLTKFTSHVGGIRPSEKIVTKCIDSGLAYLKHIEEFPYEMIGVEKRINFTVGGRKFVGILDYVGRNADGKIVIVDNKSRELKPRSGRKNPTVKDDELDSMLRQLYIYSAGIYQIYGEFPQRLCFNCFKNNVFIDEPFSDVKFNEALNWAMSVIGEVERTEIFNPNIDWFPCHWLCDIAKDCCFVDDVGEE